MHGVDPLEEIFLADEKQGSHPVTYVISNPKWCAYNWFP